MSSLRFMAPLCAIAVLAASLPAASLAAPFVSGSLALTSTKYDDVKDGTGFSLAGGYEVDEFGKFPVFVEGSYYDSGNLKVKDSGGIRLSYDGFQLFGGVALKQKAGNSRVWAKVGYYSLDGKVSDGSTSGAEKTTGLTFGLGGDWMFSEQFGARFEIEQPTKVKAIPGFNSDETTSLSIIKVGLVWRPDFSGSRSPPVERAYQAPAYAPAQTVTTAVNTSATQTVVPFTTGTVSSLRAGTGIRAQPKGDSRLLSTVSANTSVTLSGSTNNINGEWWYVTAPGVAGWVLASELSTR